MDGLRGILFRALKLFYVQNEYYFVKLFILILYNMHDYQEYLDRRNIKSICFL